MMKKILVLGMIISLFVNCGGNDSEIVKTEDKVEAVNDNFQGKEDTPLELPNFLSNDTYKTDNVRITFEATSLKNGSVTKNGDKYTYTPATGFSGTDSFKYTICSTITTSSCSTATVTIVVSAQDRPVAVDDSYDANEDASIILPNFLSNDTFISGAITITFDAISANNGAITKTGDEYTYSPASSFSGTDTFTYTICSTTPPNNCSTATVTLNVLDQGTPIAANNSYSTQENTPITLTDFLNNDTLTDDAEVESVDGSGANGTVVLNSDKTITYTPTSVFSGNDSFTYTICDDDATRSCSTATIEITVIPTTGNPGSFNIPTDLSSYYSNVNFTLTGSSLKDALASKIINSHTTFLSYTPGVWEALKKSDLDPTDNTKVLLIYGYDDNDSNHVTDRTRNKDDNGGGSDDWNREHVYPKSLGNPNLGTTGAGADAHSLRPCDAGSNSNRSNKKFANGSGNAGDSNGGWYPGDEWKGDVARMMMYMYLRYGSQCLPKNVAIGSVNSSDSNMIDLLLQWNVEDPISDFEINRNNIIKDEQGNRNPFIDNPYLATVIWGGTTADNTWK